MVNSRTHTQRATTWLCLAVAVLLSLLPAGGMIVCLGHDGHLGLGLGVASIDGGESSCPCEHGDVLAGVTRSEAIDVEHPPCDDVSLEAPEVFKDSGLAPSLAKAVADLGGDDLPPLGLPSWSLASLAPEALSSREASWAAATSRRPRQQLELRRSVVLLI